MMTAVLAFLLAGTGATPAPVGAASDTLHCRVTTVSAANPRRCTVRIPPGRTVRICASADAAALHCDKRANRRYVTWVTESNGAKCRLSRKRSDWTKVATVRMTQKTPARAAACDLYVVLHR